jgi:hypothetical protein
MKPQMSINDKMRFIFLGLMQIRRVVVECFQCLAEVKAAAHGCLLLSLISALRKLEFFYLFRFPPEKLRSPHS